MKQLFIEIDDLNSNFRFNCLDESNYPLVHKIPNSKVRRSLQKSIAEFKTGCNNYIFEYMSFNGFK
jgi:hypothetical protein